MQKHRVVVSGLAISAVILTGACSEVTPPDPARNATNIAPLFSTGHDPHSHRSRDDLVLEFTQDVPGYGGHFFDAAGALNLYMKGPAAQANAVAALRQPLRRLGLDVDGHKVRVRSAQHTFAELTEFRNRAAPVMALAGVVFLDIDDATNRVRIGVENDASEGSVKRTLALAGVPPASVLISRSEPVRLSQSLRERVRPVAGGLQINFPGFLCTTGINVRSPEHPSVQGFVIPSHCTNYPFASGPTGTPYWQPVNAIGQDNYIGVETHDLPTFTGGSCPAGRVCRWSDAAGGVYAAGVDNAFGRIYRTTGINSITIDAAAPMFTITAERAFPAVGDVLHKVGRTSGWTSGSVTASCSNVNVAGSSVTLLCQEFVTGPANTTAGGDSGSPVFERVTGSDDNVRLVGMHWGSSGTTTFIFSAMNEIRFENRPPAGSSWRTF